MSDSSWEDPPPFEARSYGSGSLFGFWSGESREGSAEDHEQAARTRHEEFVAKWKQWTAIGDLNYPSVPRYDPTAKACTKCGHAKHKVRHCDERAQEQCCKAVGRREHLHVWCKRCGHAVIRRVMQDEI